MPFIRYTRDKRGYETTYVVHGYRSPHGPGRTRVLYLFRSPANVTVGRRPLDDEARVALEHTHPDLSFDWQALGRDATPAREPANRPWRDPRAGRPAAPGAAPPAPPAPEMVIDDQSVLGRVLGGPEAARLRSRYTDLIQRIARRARSPEERDQLTERARRLNPDDWADEIAVRAGVSTAEAEWDALAGALPARRRGRRGGRRREMGPGAASIQASAIMTGGGNVDEAPATSHVDRPDSDAGLDGDDDRLGAAGNGIPGDD